MSTDLDISQMVLVLRTCNSDMTSRGGFPWPESGPVACPDWDTRPYCGNGLHGLLWGNGDARLLDWSPSARWLVVAVPADEIVDLGGKVKFPRGVVVFCGDRKAATDYLIADARCNKSVVPGSFLTGGDYSTLTGGYRSTLTGGYRSTLTGGYRSTLTGGDFSTLTGGHSSTLTGGRSSKLTGGDHSTLTGGYHSTLTGGEGSTLCVFRSDGRYRRAIIAYVGENSIKANVPYRLDQNGGFVEAV